MNIFLSRYQLKKKTQVNSLDSTDFEYGALVKVTDSSGRWGVADLKPWPLLGDLPLQKQIEMKGPLFQRSLVLAEEDLKARQNNVSLLQNKVIENNWLITDLTNLEILKSLSGTIKIKCNNQLDQLLVFLNAAAQYDLQLRLDFNGSLDAGEFDAFIFSLPAALMKKIEYIEDPLAELNSEWLNWNKKVPLAIDFAKGDAFENEKMWSYFIIKPSRQDAGEIIARCQKGNKKFTVTSAMDHPVGIAHGLRYAQEIAKNKSGFLTLEIYEKNDFNNYFTVNGCQINFSAMALADSGIGMTKTLDKLMWSPL